MTASVTATRSLHALLSCADHRNAAVRGKVAEHLLTLVKSKTSELRGQKEMSMFLMKLAKLIGDQSPEARAASRDIIRSLINSGLTTYGEAERLLTTEVVDKCLKEDPGGGLKREVGGMGREGGAASKMSGAGLTVSGKQRSPRPGRLHATAAKEVEDSFVPLPPTNVPPSTGREYLTVNGNGSGSAMGGSRADARPPLHPMGGRVLAEGLVPSKSMSSTSATGGNGNTSVDARRAAESNKLESLPELLAAVATKNWNEKKNGLIALADYVIGHWQSLIATNKLEDSIDAILGRIEDGSMKVHTRRIVALFASMYISY